MLESDDGIGFAPLLLVFVRAVLVRVDHRVALESVAHRFDESRLGVGACLLDDLARLEHHLAHIHPVDLD